MIGVLTYEEVLQATMRSNWIHALWLFAVVVLIWVCTILLTLYGNRKKKPKDKDDSWQVSVFLLVLVVIACRDRIWYLCWHIGSRRKRAHPAGH